MRLTRKMRPAETAVAARIVFAARRRWRTVSSFPEATSPRSHLRDVPAAYRRRRRAGGSRGERGGGERGAAV